MIAQYPSGRVAYLAEGVGQYPSGRTAYMRGLGKWYPVMAAGRIDTWVWRNGKPSSAEPLPQLPTTLPKGRAEILTLPVYEIAPPPAVVPQTWFDQQWIPGVPNYWLLVGGLFGFLAVSAARVR